VAGISQGKQQIQVQGADVQSLVGVEAEAGLADIVLKMRLTWISRSEKLISPTIYGPAFLFDGVSDLPGLQGYTTLLFPFR
jgi:hypothetical protein